MLAAVHNSENFPRTSLQIEEYQNTDKNVYFYFSMNASNVQRNRRTGIYRWELIVFSLIFAGANRAVGEGEGNDGLLDERWGFSVGLI